MLWTVSMAAIAATGKSERTWYVAVLDRCRRELDITSSVALKNTLKDFLWFEHTNDPDADDLWEELQGLNPFGIRDDGVG